ncbi:MAG: rane-bound lytic murein transglycosylase [Lacunisphaera sp.]|nr:rane-bound lytic murein transglycosylase [Lacunisphaera sp.]
MATMRSNFFLVGVLLALLVPAARAQNGPDNTRVDLANLRQDVLLLSQRVGELTMAVEQLNRDNSALQAKAGQSYVTLEQLNRSIADVNRSLQGALAEQKRETLNQVSNQMERLAKQTQAAIDALAKNQATRPPVQTNFSEDFPKEGVNYTVVNGDTLSGIAKKTGGKLSDIRNANKITDDAKVRVGQTLFIPNGK